MKRSLFATLALGLASALLVSALHFGGALAWPERFMARSIFGAAPNDIFAGSWQLALITTLALAVAWVMVETRGAARRCLVFLFLIAELGTLAWVLSLVHRVFQPLPAILAATMSFALSFAYHALHANQRRQATAELLRGRVAQSLLDSILETDSSLGRKSVAHDASVLICAIANESELADDLAPEECASLLRAAIERAKAVMLAENGYLCAADGEGIRVVFGFPLPSDNHAADAARAALAVLENFAAAARENPDSLGKVELRIGISSGEIIAAKSNGLREAEILITGAPFERARRFCLANKTYGSRILIGPRTFTSASDQIVARPIDFLTGADPRDRVEVYEVLSTSSKAALDVVARRDRFWNAVVYFREKRWNEAFAEFQKARMQNGEEDAPLQWYLRRLEPLCLQIATEPGATHHPQSAS